MKKCKHCGVQVAGHESICPLCQTTIGVTAKEQQNTMYPDIQFNVDKYNFFTRAFLFFTLALGFVLLQVNFLMYDGLWWSLIGVGAILYVWMTMLFSIKHNTNAGAKILIQTIGAQALSVFIDVVLGYQGWSVNYAIPVIFLVGIGAMFMLMIINFMNWQSYILFQIGYVILSMILVILFLLGVVTKPILSFISVTCAVILLLGTMIFGDRKAKNELKRRFHL